MLFSDTDEFILGYGSLLSHDSRWRFSAINTAVLPVSVQGWQRSWITRNIEEQQSHVGAIPKENTSLSGVLVPTERITDRLRQREKDYQFTPVSLSRLTLQVDASQIGSLQQQLQQRKIWICQSLDIQPANRQFPVMQSYVDTCLVGCLENGGEDFARAFIGGTEGWNEGWINDRKAPRYPRAARVDRVLQLQIDQLLDEFDLLGLRQPD